VALWPSPRSSQPGIHVLVRIGSPAPGNTAPRQDIGGVLGDPSKWAEEKAECEACAREIERKEQLRYEGIIILDDYREDYENGC